MDQQASDLQKQKRSHRRSWGWLRFLLIPVLLAVACYGGMWVLARYGGDWVMRDQFPVPPGSEAILVSHIYVSSVTTVYVHSWTPDELHT